jgi:hypothetical protein
VVIASASKIEEQCFAQSGTDVMIFKIFSPKNLAKKMAFFAHIKAEL